MAVLRASDFLGRACVVATLLTPACTETGQPYEPYEPEVTACDDGFRLVDQLQLTANRDVDILFVIDNSGSMAEEQVALNAGIGELFSRLDAADANYRIGFTTTDNGNPWCPSGTTTPEGGKLVLSPCTQRLGDFVFNNGQIDAQDLACNSQCVLDEAALAITPTTTDLDSNAAARPWIELVEGVPNLPAATDFSDAFACFAPQGINGCGFESPLESMYLSLVRAQDSSEANYGFLRANAILAVVLLSDEADCSYSKEWSEIFEANGNKAFWSDPSSAFPTSAVCWNAGVECTGDPSGYSSCEPMNKDLTGAVGVSDASAVLHPMSRYAGLLQGLEAQKQELNADQELIVMAIAGVEGGGAEWSVSYAEGDDPQFVNDFGIGPGCTNAAGERAVPPVRMRALVEEFSPEGLYSVCEGDYSDAMAGLGEAIDAQLLPACFTKCIGDSDLTTPQLEPSCVLEQDPPGNDNTERVRECERDPETTHYRLDAASGRPALPEGADVCFAMLRDPDGQQTADPLDDMSAVCTGQNFNLEFDIVRREGVPAIGGTSISVTCELSPCPEIDCPGIGG